MSSSRNPPDQKLGMSTRHPGGVPDFIEKWGPGPFRHVGFGLVAASVGSFGLVWLHEVGHIFPVLLSGATAGYWVLGLRDLAQQHQALRRNFPVLIHVRYLLESIRPEIQQYLIESDEAAVPYSREMRSIIYQRSKGLPDTRALGTKRNVYLEGHEWAAHSMFPVHVSEEQSRVCIGGPACAQPYSASILNISAMSYGALSGNAVSALNDGAAKAGCYHNTGEGGISKFHKRGADITWNIGTGYFACGGTRSGGERCFDAEMFAENAALDQVKMIEIKLSQGAKPAHGGVLPAAKITPAIAEARGLGEPPYADCNSPPRHSAFGSAMGLMRFVQQLRERSGGKPVGIKLCVGQPEELACLVHAMVDSGVTPDFITIDGAEGGTGAAPLEFQNSLGFPLAEGVRLVDSFLVGAGLRDDVKLIGSGKVYSGFSLVRTLAHGADLTNAARSFMFSLGCIQALKCNANTCPTGITTQNPDLESGNFPYPTLPYCT
jgi:glutamate synthase domain-containing protein 2